MEPWPNENSMTHFWCHDPQVENPLPPRGPSDRCAIVLEPLLCYCIKHLSLCCLAYFLLRCSRPLSRRSSSSRALPRRTRRRTKSVKVWKKYSDKSQSTDLAPNIFVCVLAGCYLLSFASILWSSSSLWSTSETSSCSSSCSLTLWAWLFCHSA